MANFKVGYRFAILIGLILTVIVARSSAIKDRSDCKEIECPTITEVQCPGDSVLDTFRLDSTRSSSSLLSDNLSQNLFKPKLQTSSIVDDADAISRNVHNRRHTPINFENYLTENKPLDEDSDNHLLNKRSLQYKRRESIQIVPGDYISLVPESGRLKQFVGEHQHKWKRETDDEATTTTLSTTVINDTTEENSVAVADNSTTEKSVFDGFVKAPTTTVSTDIANEDKTEDCCPKPPKCVCSGNCKRPTCHYTTHVLIETKSGDSDKPGECCNQYECSPEPDCGILQNTKTFWLKKCLRCKCVSGQKLCQNDCVDDSDASPFACLSGTGISMRHFSNGETWKDDECTHCECVQGEKKCQTSFCRPLNCANKIKLPGDCCPICLAEHSSTTGVVNVTETANDTGVAEEITEAAKTEDSLSSSTESEKNTPTATPVTIIASVTPPFLESTTPTVSPSAKSVHPSPPPRRLDSETIEKIEPDKENVILYVIIVILLIACAVFVGLYCYERTKKRSYRSVPSFDSNLNKLPTPIINA